METLTKENFWDEMEQNYPKSMAHFKEWIDKYKSEQDWDKLFNAGDGDGDMGIPFTAPKYHELPIAIQFGIFLEYLHYIKNDSGYFFSPIRSIPDNFSERARTGIKEVLSFVEVRLINGEWL